MWTNPPPFSDDVLIDETVLNTYLQANLRYLKGLDGVPYIESAIELPEMATPATPSSGRGRLYFKSDGHAYGLNDAGTEQILSGRNLGAHVWRSTAQSLATGTPTAISFDTERYDVGGLWGIGSPTRLTVPATGRYLVTANASFAANATGVRSIDIYRNGATVVGSNLQAAASGIVTIIAISRTVRLAASDYLEMFCFQSSGGALNINSAGEYSPEFTLEWIGPE